MSEENRRPIKVRDNRLAIAFAAKLAQKGVLPNQISLVSIGFAFFAGLCFFIGLGYTEAFMQRFLLVLAVVGIQGRLLCNLFDGMVAVEGGLKTPGGEILNELPDRISDSFILVLLGYGLNSWSWAAHLGWVAALLAMATAYVRVLGGSCGLTQKFSGPMAKPHRMALLSIAALLAAVCPEQWSQMILLLSLIVVALGSAWTACRRTRNILEDLYARSE